MKKAYLVFLSAFLALPAAWAGSAIDETLDSNLKQAISQAQNNHPDTPWNKELASLLAVQEATTLSTNRASKKQAQSDFIDKQFRPACLQYCANTFEHNSASYNECLRQSVELENALRAWQQILTTNPLLIEYTLIMEPGEVAAALYDNNIYFIEPVGQNKKLANAPGIIKKVLSTREIHTEAQLVKPAAYKIQKESNKFVMWFTPKTTPSYITNYFGLSFAPKQPLVVEFDLNNQTIEVYPLKN